jgi:uroporphyrinogen III methyltransferase/synthase
VSSKGKVWLVGAGPGDPGLLTRKAARAIAECDVLVYDYLASEAIVSMAPETCEKIYVGKKADKHTMPQDEITALIVRLGLEGKRVVRLKGGDVFVFARGGEEATELHDAGVPFEIIPGLTSAITAPAYAGIPITHRDHNTSFTIATGHEDPLKGYSSLDFQKLANPAQTLVFLMAMGSLAGIVAKLREHGVPGDMPVAIVREGTKPTQETLVATLDTIVAEVARTQFKAPAIVVIGHVVSERESIRWFDNGPLFGKRVLVTRPREQTSDFLEALYGVGAQPVLAPAIAIGPPDDWATARNATTQLGSYAWIVFTSQNGVSATFEHLASRGADARAFGGAKVAAVGPKTAASLATHGIVADFVPATFTADDVAMGVIARSAAGDRVLFLGARDMREGPIEALRANDRVVDVVAMYATSAVHDATMAERARETDVWTFASASAIDSFVANVPDAVTLSHGKTIACIGTVTAAAATAHGFHVDVVPHDFTVDGLVAALLEPVLTT